MAVLQVEYLENLAADRLNHLLNRSRENVSQVLEEVRKILTALRRGGDAESLLTGESLRWHRQYQADLATGRLEVSPAEIDAAYQSLDPRVLEALQAAAANIEAFHQAQREREMWAVEIRPGILAGQAGAAHSQGGLLHPRRPGELPLERPHEHHPGQGCRG